MNKDIISAIKQKQFLRDFGGVSNEDIIKSEKEINARFSEAYKDYLREFGAISFYGHEITGICSSERLNVAIVTKEEKEFNDNIVDGYYVIEQINVDGIVIIQNSKDEVFKTSPSIPITKIYNTFIEYIENV